MTQYIFPAPLTLIIDSSHDTSTNHVCVLMFQTLGKLVVWSNLNPVIFQVLLANWSCIFTENDKPIIELYRALTLGPRSRGEDYLSAILLAFQEDGIFEDVQSRYVWYLKYWNQLNKQVKANILISLASWLGPVMAHPTWFLRKKNQEAYLHQFSWIKPSIKPCTKHTAK